MKDACEHSYGPMDIAILGTGGHVFMCAHCGKPMRFMDEWPELMEGVWSEYGKVSVHRDCAAEYVAAG